ncbi:MAG: hypothetical protein ACK2UW_11490, partial [Anaerolineales bacterium]
MKKIILSLLVLSGILTLALLVITETYPFSTSSPLYRLQLSAEQMRLIMAPNAETQARLAVELADRRLADLAQIQDGSQISQAVETYINSLQSASAAYSMLPVAAQATWWDWLNPHLTQAEIVARSLAEPYCDTILMTLAAQRKSQNPELASTPFTPEPESIIAAEPVPFLGQDVKHEDFPLTGGHSDLACASCHLYGVYAETPTNCGSCHTIKSTVVGFADLPASLLLPDDLNLADPY